jgi:cytochrome o ubiquinol oxidase operon protein cyoD
MKNHNNDYSTNTDFPTPYEEKQYEAARGNIRSYSIGFVLSIILTILAYLFVVNGTVVLSGGVVAGAIIWCAGAQLLVQLVFFLHLGSGSKPRWNLIILIFTLIILFIIVGGSLWIMANLKTNMTPDSPTTLNGFTLPQQ